MVDFLMESIKSIDNYKVIASLLYDVHTLYPEVFNTASLRLTLKKVQKRLTKEGSGFLTKTLPRLGKAFDKALTGTPMNSVDCGFKPMVDSKLPMFIGEFFTKVLARDGTVLPDPCINSVQVIRDILMPFYKYELPYTDEQEQQVVQKFERTDADLLAFNDVASAMFNDATDDAIHASKKRLKTLDTTEIAYRARALLYRLFARFDPKDIQPRHGPGAVATKQQLWEKYLWTNVSAKITSEYPFDAYFCASSGHVCDHYRDFSSLSEEDLPARVVLVPKDSRGPRLISCEPVDYQWVQQGLGRAIVRLVEGHPLTKWNVFFTDQSPNQRGALLGSSTGRYATLDLNEASDRVSTGLVRLLFPEHVYTCLMACRSSSTELPDGKVIKLNKFAPMGSCLCFPIMALTIWAILTAGAPDADTRESILVYGDDVIVPTAYAVNAMEHLESFGLKINRDKSCISGFFRESCGTDAFKGVEVTPVRLRTVWSSSRSPDVYGSWIAYANSYYRRRYFSTYDYIVGLLHSVYGAIPASDMHLACQHSLVEVSEERRPKRRRRDKSLQRLEYYVWDVEAPKLTKVINGWSMLLRFFAEIPEQPEDNHLVIRPIDQDLFPGTSRFSVSQYTRRSTSVLVKRWR